MKIITPLLFTTTLIASTAAQARDNIEIVGSSTVYPFATVVAETFAKKTGMAAPKVESTGSGGGMKLFCAGIGGKHPDITNASRRIKKKELEKCHAAGVEPIEVKVGYDGIAVANSRSGPDFKLSRKALFLALAKEIPTGTDNELKPNPYTHWNQIDAALPNTKIEVIGPPPTSGTRDAFVELAMEGGCKSFDWIKATKKKDKKQYKAICHTIREDGPFIEAGENDNLIVQKLGANPNAVGIFGFSFLEQNEDTVKGASIDGTDISFDNISDGSYPVSRPLYVYLKKNHVGTVKGLENFMQEFTSDAAWGEEGYLADKGMIPMPQEERKSFADAVRNLAVLSKL